MSLSVTTSLQYQSTITPSGFCAVLLMLTGIGCQGFAKASRLMLHSSLEDMVEVRGSAFVLGINWHADWCRYSVEDYREKVYNEVIRKKKETRRHRHIHMAAVQGAPSATVASSGNTAAGMGEGDHRVTSHHSSSRHAAGSSGSYQQPTAAPPAAAAASSQKSSSYTQQQQRAGTAPFSSASGSPSYPQQQHSSVAYSGAPSDGPVSHHVSGHYDSHHQAAAALHSSTHSYYPSYPSAAVGAAPGAAAGSAMYATGGVAASPVYSRYAAGATGSSSSSMVKQRSGDDRSDRSAKSRMQVSWRLGSPLRQIGFPGLPF